MTIDISLKWDPFLEYCQFTKLEFWTSAILQVNCKMSEVIGCKKLLIFSCFYSSRKHTLDFWPLFLTFLNYIFFHWSHEKLNPPLSNRNFSGAARRRDEQKQSRQQYIINTCTHIHNIPIISWVSY